VQKVRGDEAGSGGGGGSKKAEFLEHSRRREGCHKIKKDGQSHGWGGRREDSEEGSEKGE